MPQEPGSLTVSQARALRALNYGGLLSQSQVQHAAGLAKWEARRVVQNLSSRRLIASRSYDKRWYITVLGRNTLATKPLAYGGQPVAVFGRNRPAAQCLTYSEATSPRPERAVTWIDRAMSGDVPRVAEDERRCLKFAQSRGISVSVICFGGRAITHSPHGPLCESLRLHDAALIVIPSVNHIHMSSARRMASVYAADTGQRWRLTSARAGQA